MIDQINYFEFGLDVVDAEIRALEDIKNNLSKDEFNNAIDIIINCQGKVIVVGVGKSGIIAKKIAATLCSTGTVAYNLNAVEALHGDLGIVHSSDVIITLSNSGETEEILTLLPHLKARKVTVISIVGNSNSTLACNSDVTLSASVSKEACPINLAPTASTTVALVIGDAIAATLMKVKKVKPIDFAFNHPAGNLGKRLIVKVKDLLSSELSNPAIKITATWKEIIFAVEEGKLGAVNIITDDNELIGIITDGDIRRALQKFPLDEILNLTADNLMTANPTVINEEMLAYEALLLMENRPSKISVLPVLDTNRKSIGLIRIHDLLGKFI